MCSRSLGTESPYVQLLAAPSVECLMPSRMRSETNFVLPTRFETRILLGCYSSAYYSSARALRSASGSRLGKMPCRDSPSMCARELWAVWPPVNVVTALYKYRKRSVQAGRIVSPTSYLLSCYVMHKAVRSASSHRQSFGYRMCTSITVNALSASLQEYSSRLSLLLPTRDGATAW